MTNLCTSDMEGGQVISGLVKRLAGAFNRVHLKNTFNLVFYQGSIQPGAVQIEAGDIIRQILKNTPGDDLRRVELELRTEDDFVLPALVDPEAVGSAAPWANVVRIYVEYVRNYFHQNPEKEE